jgi:outer membrane protein assembly factor BamB/subtilisin family serine protease
LFIFRKKFLKKWFAITLAVLLLVSSFLPNVSMAAEPKPESFSDAELQLEKMREQEFTSGQSNGAKNSDTFEQVEEESNELPNLLKGIGIEPKTLAENGERTEDDIKKADLNLQQAFEKNNQVNVIIRMKDKPNIESIFPQVKMQKSRTDKIKMIQNHLKQKANNSQKAIQQALNALESKGKGKKKDSLWIINGLSATLSEEAVAELKQRDDVASITLDETLHLPDVTVEEAPPKLPLWGLEKIFAPKVWGQYGLKGEGIVVGIMDSGVDGNHEALRKNYRGRDGNHQTSWIDLSGQDYDTPNDGNGHGTHVAGTAVGGGDGEAIGVAPGAEWIAAKIFNDGGSTTLSAIHRAFQWFMAPGGDPSKAPDVVNNSWGNSNTYSLEFYEDVKAWVSVGIFPSFAAGNDGPGAQTIGSPGSFPESFAVGATDIYDQTASFSSRGPVYWQDSNGGTNRLIKPDISAPGHQIYSAWPSQLKKGKYHTISGTSMATPHVTGAIALLYQANPNLTIDEVKDILKNTVRLEPHMGTLPNDSYGSGIINIYQAVTEAVFAGELIGTVKNKRGEPIAAKLEIKDEGLSYEVAGTGTFSYKIREGSHNISVSSFGYQTFEGTVKLNKGELTEVNFVLDDAEAFTVKGKVVDESGEAVPYSFIRLKNTPLLTIRTDAGGDFEIKQVPTGNYTIQVTGEGINGKSQEIHVKQDLTIELKVEETTTDLSKEWNLANGNINRNAVSANAIDVDGLEKAWEFSVEGKGDILFSTPAAANNRIVLTTDRGWVIALDSKSGKEQWAIRLGSTNSSSPTIDGNTVYLSGGQDGKIYALDLKTGTIKWASAIGGMAIYESPVIYQGTLFVSSDLTDNAHLYALNPETGDRLWGVKLGAPTYFGPSIGNGFIYVGSYDNQTIRALRVEDGTEIWQKKISSEGIASKPVFDNGVLYFTGINFNTQAGSLYAVDAATGAEKWKVSGIGDTQAGSPIVFEHMVIMGSASQPNLRAFDKESGVELWKNTSVGTTLNSGSVTANGLLFFASTNGSVSILDVYTGERLKDIILPVYSTSGIPILPGQVILPYLNGIQSYRSPGILVGRLVDEGGQPTKGTVTVVETGDTVIAEADGSFQLNHIPGNYNVRVSLYGKKQIDEKVQFVSGYKMAKSYQLEDAETGSVSITVKDKRTGNVLKGVKVELNSTGISGRTNENGHFAIDEVYEGTWNVSFSLGGYKDGNSTFTVNSGEVATISFELQPIDVAVLNDYKGQITSLLEMNGYTAEERGWDVVNDIGRYKVLYLNGGYGTDGIKPTATVFRDLVDLANVNNVSIIFTDQWGANYGSIHHLKDYYGNPADIGHDYDVGEVRLKVEAEHPILKGYKAGAEIPMLGNNADFAWFNQYSGRTIGKIGTTELGYIGSGIAYQAVSENSAHLLLSSFASVPWEQTESWLVGQHQILLNSLDYLYNSQFGKVTGKVVNSAGNPIEATVEVIETGVKAKTDAAGEFEFFHDEGTFTLEVRGKGLGTQTVTFTAKKGKPVMVNSTLGYSERGTLSGVISDALTMLEVSGVKVEVTNAEGEKVAETTSATNGRYEITGLEEETYKFSYTKDGYITHSQTVDIARHEGDVDVRLNKMPSVGVVGDYFSTGRNFKALMNEHGVMAVDIQPADLAAKMKDFDVVFINDPSSSSFNKNVFENAMKAADEAGTSVIFGDAYWSTSGINHLVNYRKDPEVRSTVRNTTQSAVYKVVEEHPIFSGLSVGEEVRILNSSASTIGYFNNYSGYPLADIKHDGSNTSHGLGIAYKPRTSGSVELLMSGHGFSSYHTALDYTPEGKQILFNAILWAANVNLPVLNGTVLDENGNPLQASIKVNNQPFGTETNPATGTYSIAITAGEYELTVSAFGYTTKTVKAVASMDGEPQTITMKVADNIATISGTVENEKDGNAIAGAKISLIGKPRTSESSIQGQFSLNQIEPGTYTIRVEKEGFVREDVEVTLSDKEQLPLKVKLMPSPTIGVIVDLTASGMTFKQYLEVRGFKVEYLSYKDIDKLDAVDLVFANSDYKPDAVPTKAEFQAFQEALDQKRKSVIWTGQAGGRGSIRYLYQYEGDPSALIEGTNKTDSKGIVKEEHPLTAGFQAGEVIHIPGKTGYYYAFNGYSGKTVVDFEQTSTGQKGSMVAYKGRTSKSLEILLANMTIGHVFHPGDATLFDEGREKLLMNAIEWALAEKAPLTGELHGVIQNEKGLPVKGEVMVKESGVKIVSNGEGMFFTALEEGTYTVTVKAFGHHDKDFTISIKNGQVLNQTFAIQSENAGTLSGKIIDASTKDAIVGAKVEVLGTPVEGVTNETGVYELTLPSGSYEVRVSASGYKPVFETVEVSEGHSTAMNISMFESAKIAVIATQVNQGRIGQFLQSHGYEPDFYLSSDFGSLNENLGDYKLIIANEISTSMREQFKVMVEKANEQQTSIIFVGQFGLGTIGELSRVYNDPEKVTSSFVDKELKIRVDQTHPIFRGFELGQEYQLLVNPTGAVQYSFYENYSGTSIGSLTNVVKGNIGSTVGFKFSSSNSVHILLSALQIGSYGNPNDRWTNNAVQIYLNAIDYALTASQGEIKGAVTDSNGNPIPNALVTIPGTDVKTATNSAGLYRIGIGVGRYEVKVQARGYVEQTKQAIIEETGSSTEVDFALEVLEGLDLNGAVVDKKTSMPIAGAAITLVPNDEPDFKGTVTSGEDGSYVFTDLLPGVYTLEVAREGYLPAKFEATISDKDITLNLEVNAFEVAVIGDLNRSLSNFLNQQEIFTEEKDWDILGQVNKYKAIIVNTNSGTKEQVDQLIQESDEQKVSLIFTGTWGVKEGSIQLLKQSLGSPDFDQHGYNEGAVFVKALTVHPIFAGVGTDENGQIRILSEKSPYATFKNFSGLTLAGLNVDGTDKGDSIAYDFRSKDHIHLLLSTFAVTNIIGPDYGWTKEGKQLFTNAVKWSIDVQQQLPNAPIWESEWEMVREKPVIVKGKADPCTTVRIFDKQGNKEVLLGEVKTAQDGSFSVELDIQNGEYTLTAEAENFSGKTVSLTTMKLLVVGKPEKKDKN